MAAVSCGGKGVRSNRRQELMPRCCPVQVGWKHQEAVAMLEEKRKVSSAAFYQEKKKLTVLRAKAKQEAMEA